VSTGSPLHVDKRGRDGPPPGKPPFDDMVWIPGGPFLMGSNDHYPRGGAGSPGGGERLPDGPVRRDQRLSRATTPACPTFASRAR